MIINFDSFNRYEVPNITLCRPNDSQVGTVDNIKDLEITPTFNAVSELSCTVYKYMDDMQCQCYDLIKNRKQFLVENFGYFIIATVEEENKGTKEAYKTITAESCELELSGVDISTLEDGTYTLADLMDIIMVYLPRWTLSPLPASISSISRKFEDITGFVYTFLMTNVEDAYGCLFEFDAQNRNITVYDKNNFVTATNILLTNDEIVNKIKETENITDMCTAIKPTGSNDLNVRYANPVGTGILYNFHYYKTTEWMSQELINALNAWEYKVSTKETTYSDILLDLIAAHANKVSKEADLSASQIRLDQYDKAKSIIISEGKGLDVINASIADELSSTYNVLQSAITAAEGAIATYEQQTLTINDELSLTNLANFSSELYIELTSHIKCSNYSNENITTTQSMTQDVILARQMELYNESKTLLAKISEPKLEYTTDTESFIFLKEFSNFTNQLKTGCLIDIQLAEDDIATLILLSMPINFTDGTVTFTFGNRYRLSNQSALISDLYNNVSSSAATVENLKSRWNYGEKSGLNSKTEDYINSALNLTKNKVVSADGQSTTITDSGIHTRKIVDEILDPKEVVITNGTIAFTNNNFETSNLVLGTTLVPDPKDRNNPSKAVEGTGIIADFLVGEQIISDTLLVTNAKNTFSVDKDDIYLSSYSTTEATGEKIAGAIKVLNTEITATIEKSNGTNKLYGTAAVNLNDWTISGTGTVSVDIIDEGTKTDIQNNTSSQRAFYLTGASKLSQTFNTIINNNYAYYFKYRVVTGGSTNATCQIVNAAETSATGDAINLTATTWTEVKGTYKSTSDSQKFLLDVPVGVVLLISDIIIAEGVSISTWAQAPTEIQTESMTFDSHGLHVGKSGDIIETNITNSEFSVLNTISNEKLAYFNELGSEFGKTHIRKSLTVGTDSTATKAFSILPQGNGHAFITIYN